MCNDPATTKAKTLAFVSLLNQSIKQSINESITASHCWSQLSKTKLLPGYIIPFHPIQATIRGDATVQIIWSQPEPAERTKATTESPWFGYIIRVHDNTTTLAFVSLLVQTIIQSNHSSTHPGGPISPRRNYFRVALYPFLQPKLRDVTASQHHSLTAQANRTNEPLPYLVHTSTRQHETTRHALV